MKIALIGYGKMGQVIESIALERGHEITGRYRSQDHFDVEDLKKADAAIEFSVPTAAKQNIEKCFAAHLPVVIGTTGWYEHFDEISHHCRRNKGAMLYATNFSVGVNIFFELNRLLARMMNTRPEYKVHLHEIHHIHKLDAPSGTGITLAEGILGEMDNLKDWREEDNQSEDSLLVTSARLGEVPGTHEITYESEVDAVFIQHKAKNRKGFALGAVLAAEWLADKEGVFTMRDMLKI